MDYYLYYIRSIKDKLLHNRSVHFLTGMIAIISGLVLYSFPGMKIFSIRCVCWAGRVIEIRLIENIAFLIIKYFFLQKTTNNETTRLETICLSSGFLKKNTKIYSMESGNKVSLFRDIFILKEKTEKEKGVILIKYTPAFDAFYHYYYMDKIYIDYYVILEPSWAGACDPSFLIFWRDQKNQNVVVQTNEEKDFNFIKNVQGNFIPIEIGAGDWVDSQIFNYDPKKEKEYDLVMVSNWSLHKNHKELFKALSITKKNLSVVLIGFESNNRTKDDILREINSYSLQHIKFNIFENISAKEVASILNKSKVYILLSEKEGANKAIVEAFYVNVPAILNKKFVGGRR